MLYKTISRSEPLRFTKNGKEITVTVNRIKGISAVLGIDCPEDIDVKRPDAKKLEKKTQAGHQNLKIKKKIIKLNKPMLQSQTGTTFNPNANKPILSLKKKAILSETPVQS